MDEAVAEPPVVVDVDDVFGTKGIVGEDVLPLLLFSLSLLLPPEPLSLLLLLTSLSITF